MKKSIRLVLFIIAVLVLIILVFIPLHFTTDSTEDADITWRTEIIAHRGASAVAPENTLPAIDSAIAAGADCIEIDVHLSKDNKVVVIHDKTVDRTTNGSGRVSELTSDYIKTLDAGSWFDEEFMGIQVPFLEEIIETVNAQTKLLIEIKKGKEEYNGIEKEVAALIIKHHAEEWCIVQSFSDKSLEEVHKDWPGIKLHKLFVFKFRFLPYVFDGGITYFDFKKYEYVDAFNIHQRFTEDRFLRKIHAGGKKANAWGCVSKGSCKLKNMRLWDGLITDYPGNYKAQ